MVTTDKTIESYSEASKLKPNNQEIIGHKKQAVPSREPVKTKEIVSEKPHKSKILSTIDYKPQDMQRFQPLPPPLGYPPYHLSIEDVLSKQKVNDIKTSKSISFHVVGSTGAIMNTVTQQIVAKAMEANFNDSISFLYHLGDVTMSSDSSEYYSQFYFPYSQYPALIFAIPGDRDGDPLPALNERSLDAFLRNFCANEKTITQDARNLHREAMIQPNVY